MWLICQHVVCFEYRALDPAGVVIYEVILEKHNNSVGIITNVSKLDVGSNESKLDASYELDICTKIGKLDTSTCVHEISAKTETKHFYIC